MSAYPDLCVTCRTAYLKLTGEVVVQGESAGEFRDIGSRRVFMCGNCGQRQVRIRNHEYIKIGADVKTEPGNERK